MDEPAGSITPRSYSAFVSHASVDRRVADTVVEHLERQGLTCWIAPRDVQPGEEYPDAIIRGIQSSRCFVLVFSEAANLSANVRREIERAASRGLPIYPVRIEDVPPSPTLEYFISMHQWIDAFDGVVAEGAARLAAAIKGIGPVPVLHDPQARPAVARPVAARKRRHLAAAGLAAGALGAVGAASALWVARRDADPPRTATPVVPTPALAPAVPDAPAATREAALVRGGVDGDFFRPNVVASYDGWSGFLPTRASARYVSMVTEYSVDGAHYETARSPERFFLRDRPPSNKLWLRVQADGTRHGPFVYEYDFGAMKTASLIRDRLSRGFGTARVVEPIPGTVGGFPIIANMDGHLLSIQAVTEQNPVQYQIDVGTGFYETLQPNPDKAAVLDVLALGGPKPGAATGVLVQDRSGQKYGPVFYRIDVVGLMKIAWQATFKEAEALFCQPSVSPAPPQLRCYAQNLLLGVSTVEYGAQPDRLDHRIDLRPTDADLLTYTPQSTMFKKSVWEFRLQDCARTFDQPGNQCALPMALPGGTTSSAFVRFTYDDGRRSDVLRFTSGR